MMLRVCAAIHDHRAAHTFRGMLAADQMPLDQNLLFQGRELFQIFRKRVLHLRQLLRPAVLINLEDFDALRLLGPAGNGFAASDCAPAGRGC